MNLAASLYRGRGSDHLLPESRHLLNGFYLGSLFCILAIQSIFMKRILLPFIFLMCFSSAIAQFVTIPDAKFVQWLQANVPSAMVGNQMDTTDAMVSSLKRIYVENDSIGDLFGVQFFDSLITLDCGNGQFAINKNYLQSLPSLPISMDTLICGYNYLTGLPILPPGLKYLACYCNNITALPSLPNSLTYLDCHINQISGSVSWPGNLDYLNCNTNQFADIQPLPNSLTYLDCGYNPLITNFTSFPPALVQLHCWTDQLTSLPALPTGLVSFSCGWNSLTSLPTLPSSLQMLSCSNNLLTSLPSLPGSLGVIYTGNNQLTALPTLPSSLQSIWCNDNFLTSLPTLPSALVNLQCFNNNISCFDPFSSAINYIDISNNPFNCLPNYIPAMDQVTLSYPLCPPGNSNSCINSEGVFGHIYEDKNSNCSRDGGDSSLRNMPIYIYDTGFNLLGQTISAANGVYGFPQTNGSYLVFIDDTQIPCTASCIYPGTDSLVTVAFLDTSINFPLACKFGFDIGVQSTIISGWVFPGQQHTLNLNAGDMSHWYNLNCAAGISGQVQITVNGPVAFVGPAPGALTPSVSGNTYTYAISDFGLANNSTDFNLVFSTNTNAQAGDTVCVSVVVTPTAGDNNVSNNTFYFCYLVVNSHDPNVKEVYPIDVAPLYNDWFTYTIHFQNTGTAPAFNINLVDTLDTNLDLSTFQVLNYSHQNTAHVNGSVLSFNFPNIMLADSGSNMAGSQGYVQYRIKPKPGLPAGTQIKNTANIYFDFNPAVVTNTTINNFIAGIGVKESTFIDKVRIYPNPAQSSVSLEAPVNSKASIYSITGELVMEKSCKTGKETFDVSELSKGVYILKVESREGVCTKKLIKE